MDELAVGDPSRLATDVGPVIDAEAQGQLAGPHRPHEAHGEVAPPDAAARRRRRHLRRPDHARDPGPRRAQARGVRPRPPRPALPANPTCRR